jgi:hypothetical protein
MQPFKSHSQGGKEMTTTFLVNDTHVRICKQLSGLPPVVSDWQQSCQQPRCPHYCQGECCHPGRQWASAPCPFDGKELLLEDAPAIEDSLSMTIPGVPKKG